MTEAHPVPIADEPIVVEFPLRGEWTAYHTPAERVPSHGTDQLAQRYAYDFMRIDPESEGWKFCRSAMRRYHLVGVRLDDCYAWGQPIHAPFGGTVVTARDGWPERSRLHVATDLAVVLKNALTFNPGGLHGLTPVLGNHVVIKMANEDVYALCAHARSGSVRVRAGDAVATGAPLAEVGHSGNSTAPHLHFQLMDAADPLVAAGVPCAFREYEVLRGTTWSKRHGGMPGKREFVRC